MTEALQLVRKKLINVIGELSKFADKYKSLPTLAFTHFQPAQPTTVSKRATLWLNKLVTDLEDVDYVLSTMKLLGCKGTTGTQASFLELFNGDHTKIRQIDGKIAQKMGFDKCVPVSGQTYSRKVDTRVLNVLADALNPSIVSSTQWFERTLDDSANKRMSVPERFLAVDGILDLYLNVVDGLVVYEKVINRRLMSELPFMARGFWEMRK